MIELDVATGLPALPDGWRWEVVRVSPGDYTLDQVFYFLELKQSVVHTIFATTGWPMGRYYPRSFWGWLTRKPRVKRPLPEPTTVWITRARSGLDHLTPADILSTATDVWSRYTASLLAEELLGTYPPKRLVQEDTTDD